MKVDMNDALVRHCPLSIIGHAPVERLRHPVLLNRDGENTGLHDLQELLQWMTTCTPPTGPLTRKPILSSHIEPVLLTRDGAVDTTKPTACRYQETLNILLATLVQCSQTVRVGDLLDMRADPAFMLPCVPEGPFNTLHVACQKCHPEMVAVLLAHGAKALPPAAMAAWLQNAATPRGRTALHMAVAAWPSPSFTSTSTTASAPAMAMDPVLAIVRCLLKHKADPNVVDDDAETPLTLVMRREHRERRERRRGEQQQHHRYVNSSSSSSTLSSLVHELLAAKASAATTTTTGRAPLRAAIENGCAIDVLDALVSAGACPHGVCYPGQPACLALAVARGPAEEAADYIRFLAGAGARVADADLDGRTAFHEAAARDDGATVRLLRALFPDVHPDADDADGNTPLHLAAMHFAASAAAALLHQTCSPAASSAAAVVLVSASQNDDDDDVSVVMMMQPPPPQQRTGAAAADGYAYTDGAECFNLQGHTPAHVAVAAGNLPFLLALERAQRREEERARYLVCAQLTRGGLAPLHLAVLSSRAPVAMLRHLLERGADPNALTWNAEEPPHDDVVYVGRNETLPPHARIDGESAPLHLALLLLHQKKKTKPANEAAAEVVEALLEYGANPNLPHRRSGDMPLHVLLLRMSTTTTAPQAEEEGDAGDMISSLRHLLRKGASVNARRYRADGATPLHVAVSGRRGGAGARAVRALLLATANPNLRCIDSTGSTPLHVAAGNSLAMRYAVPLLLAAGADPTLHDARGQTALDVALAQLALVDRLSASLVSAWPVARVRRHARLTAGIARLRAASLMTTMVPTPTAEAGMLEEEEDADGAAQKKKRDSNNKRPRAATVAAVAVLH